MKTVLNSALKNAFKLIKAEKTGSYFKRVITEIGDMFAHKVECRDEIYEFCFHEDVFEIITTNGRAENYIELAEFTFTHMKETKSDFNLQKYLKKGTNLGLFLAESDEKYDLNLDVSEFYSEDDQRKKRYFKSIASLGLESKGKHDEEIKLLKSGMDLSVD